MRVSLRGRQYASLALVELHDHALLAHLGKEHRLEEVVRDLVVGGDDLDALDHEGVLGRAVLLGDLAVLADDAGVLVRAVGMITGRCLYLSLIHI